MTRLEDARHAAASGADFLGAFLTAGFPRSVATETARAFAESDAPALVAILVNESAESAARIGRDAGASVLQLHGEEPPATVDALRAEGWAVWKALRPRSVDELRLGVERYGDRVDGLLLDGWHPGARGGTGTRVSWTLVESMRRELPSGALFVLAGGLTPENVAEAAERLRPDVVDVSSGVEVQVGRKDPARVEGFIQAARAAADNGGTTRKSQ